MTDYEKLGSQVFTFMGRELCFNEMKKWERIKVYKESSHLDRVLVKDELGNLYIYEFYEYVNFDGPDEIYNTYTYVTDENDADRLNAEPDIRRKNCVRFNPNLAVTVI